MRFLRKIIRWHILTFQGFLKALGSENDEDSTLEFLEFRIAISALSAVIGVGTSDLGGFFVRFAIPFIFLSYAHAFRSQIRSWFFNKKSTFIAWIMTDDEKPKNHGSLELSDDGELVHLIDELDKSD